MTPSYRRPRRVLSPPQVAALVALRDGGATWREIGRLVGKQDCACKRIYDRALQTRPTITTMEEEGTMSQAA